MDKKYFVVPFSISVIIIIVLSYVIVNAIDKEKPEDVDSGLVLLASGENAIFGNETQIQTITNNTEVGYSYIESNDCNDTEMENIAERFFTKANLDEDYSGTHIKYINGTSTNEEIFVNKNNYIHYINNKYIDKSYKSSDLLPENKIVTTAKSLIKKYRGNTSDLSLVEYYTPVNHKGEVEITNGTDNSTIIGYGNQVVIFIQNVDGVNITGAKGKLLLRLGPNGKLVDYIDKTVNIETIKTFTGSKIKTLLQSLNVLANRPISYTENAFIVNNWEYVYHFPSSSLERAYLHLEITLKGKNDGTEYIHYIDSAIS